MIGSREDRIALYADDMLLFMSNPQVALTRAIELLNTFGIFSGLYINWSKSSLMPLSSACSLGPDNHFCRLPILDHFKYLGIYISNNHKTLVQMNVHPLIDHFKSKFRVCWINLLKMVVLPKCLYALQHSPVMVPRQLFCSMESLMSTFI